MQTQVKEWGNSQGIRLPKEVLKSAGITLNEVFRCYHIKWRNYLGYSRFPLLN